MFNAPLTTPEKEIGAPTLDIVGSVLLMDSRSNFLTAIAEKFEADSRISRSIWGLLPEPPVFTILAMLSSPSRIF